MPLWIDKGLPGIMSVARATFIQHMYCKPRCIDFFHVFKLTRHIVCHCLLARHTVHRCRIAWFHDFIWFHSNAWTIKQGMSPGGFGSIMILNTCGVSEEIFVLFGQHMATYMMAIYGNIWQYMAIYGNIWQYTAIYGQHIKSIYSGLFMFEGFHWNSLPKNSATI